LPYPSEHAARIKDPNNDEKFARKTIADGIDIILGLNKGQKSETQAYRFKKTKFTADKAKEWLKTNKIKYLAFEEASKKEIQSLNVSIQSFISKLSQDEIIKMIPSDILAKIKQKDTHPYFSAYSICHEGMSNPKILNSENKPIIWHKKAIQSIKNIILKGVNFFKGHNKDSSINNRESLGEVIADTQKEIDGVLHHIVIGYHPKDKIEQIKKLNICSQEGIWNLIESGNKYIADSLDKITGIALANSNEEIPAFGGAKQLGLIQAFDSGETRKYIKTGEGKKNMASIVEDIKQQVKDHNIWPKQIFDEQQIKDDYVFGKVYGEIDKLKTENETLKKDLEIKNQSISQYIQKEKNALR